MVRDRLKEFQDAARAAGNTPADTSLQVEPGDDPLLALLDNIGILYTNLKKISSEVSDIQRKIHTAHESHQRMQIDDEIDKLKSEARKVRKGLDEIKSKASTDDIIGFVANTHHLSLAIRLSQAIYDLSGLSTDTHDRHMQYVRKELLITRGRDFQEDIDENELEALLEQPKEIFAGNLIKETQEARQQLQDLQDRHEAVRSLEKSITELAHLFQDLAVLVHEQGEKVDRIENYTFIAKEKAAAAQVQLKEAVVNQHKARKKKFICGLIGTVVVVVVLLIIIFSFV
ncbi:unnamed protein product [Meganyctiphanes norvegica]|uniref:t-SNARE coiled-coil homology domain-containing protein n=1 Tax=Meganyctiphanes norvegica TaxID=48144 RepID=A0AAV2RK79_MEGNR